jgi:DNA-directed RNA polymerase subunit L
MDFTKKLLNQNETVGSLIQKYLSMDPRVQNSWVHRDHLLENNINIGFSYNETENPSMIYKETIMKIINDIEQLKSNIVHEQK